MQLGQQNVARFSTYLFPQWLSLIFILHVRDALQCRTLNIFHNFHEMNHFCSITPFSHDTEYNTNSQPRHTGENRSGITFAATNISLSASLSNAQNRSKTKCCLIAHLTRFSRYFHDIFTISSLHHFSHLCQES